MLNYHLFIFNNIFQISNKTFAFITSIDKVITIVIVTLMMTTTLNLLHYKKQKKGVGQKHENLGGDVN